MELPLGSLLRLDGEVGPPGVADEEAVAGEHEPRLVAARAVGHREAAVLGTVPGRVDRANDDVADLDLRPVLERLVLEGRARDRVDAHGNAVLEREPSVARDVVGVRVRLEDAESCTPRRAASARIGSIAYGGSTTTATPACSSPTRYEAQPRSSSRNCLKSTSAMLTPVADGIGSSSSSSSRQTK